MRFCMAAWSLGCLCCVVWYMYYTGQCGGAACAGAGDEIIIMRACACCVYVSECKKIMWCNILCSAYIFVHVQF